MRATLIVLSALSISLPAFGQACGDEGRYFHLNHLRTLFHPLVNTLYTKKQKLYVGTESIWAVR